MTAWFIAAAAVLIVELFVGTVYLLVVSAALFGAGLVYWLTGDTSIAVAAAAVLSAAGIWLVHGKFKKTAPRQELNDDLDIGQTVHILQRLHGDCYEVSYRGTRWQAQAENADAVQTTSTAVITGKNGNVLLIRLN
ncbi:MAG: NfeD family protein [Neisseria sicca]|jgi:nodulation efficiency nfeD family protein|uniref:NfeD family protein n=1 Tax=Neisseria sicca TaxID=490 RepID=A0A2I1XFD8_NEISI|nr:MULTISPECIES: NfeD family protein [Neisseria]MBY6282690.1 NfeD family protein [Neisseria flava]OFJ77328.1 nodulation efficiency NfeD family protein [Neisseria sp. HMSC072F04]OFN01915.1 nodulation efficiency NfeD family protein [Neisseria sp. HMSC055F11]OHR44476.1 nodulation efficiency NfeD family protein [Neisseria sp. HMSC070E12]MBF1264160.1 NfeD family protein [Neisseria sicca]